MDRELAIERLNKMRRVCDMEECNTNCELCDEALDLAIKALSGDMYCPSCGVRLVPENEYVEPKESEEEVDYCNNCPYISYNNEDCISRQQAVEEMSEVPFALCYDYNMEQDELVDTIVEQIRGCV